VVRRIGQAIQQGAIWLEVRFKQWTRPATGKQVVETLADLKRSKRELIAENMLLRQQLIVLERQVVCPKMTQRDRQMLMLLASRIKGWREALIIVKPDTLIGWHRLGFKLYWRRKIASQAGQTPDPGGNDHPDRRDGYPQSNLACQTDSGRAVQTSRSIGVNAAIGRGVQSGTVWQHPNYPRGEVTWLARAGAASAVCHSTQRA
jgi:hypothetical protein